MADEQKTREGKSWRDVGLVILGSALALVVSICTNLRQTASQRSQLLLDRKISVLREYARTGNRGNEILFKIKTIEFALQSSAPDGTISSEITRLNTEYPSMISETISWMSELNVEGTIVTALFKERTPRFKLSNAFKKAYPVRAQGPISPNEMKEILKTGQQDTEFLRDSIIMAVQDVQDITEKLAQHLD